METTISPIDDYAKSGVYVLLFGPSGYITTPLRCEVCRYEKEHSQPWINHAGDSFIDGGEPPIGYLPLPKHL